MNQTVNSKDAAKLTDVDALVMMGFPKAKAEAARQQAMEAYERISQPFADYSEKRMAEIEVCLGRREFAAGFDMENDLGFCLTTIVLFTFFSDTLPITQRLFSALREVAPLLADPSPKGGI